MTLLRPRRLRPGDRVALVAPASAFPREEFETGVLELRALGFEPVYEESVFETEVYEAGSASVRATALRRALQDPSVAAVIGVRGGYGSVKVLPLLDAQLIRSAAKPVVGYSDLTSLLSYCTVTCGIVSFHGPTVAGRLSRGAAGYDRDTFVRSLCQPEPLGALEPPHMEALAHGEAVGPIHGGTLTQLTASLATPFAFDPPAGHVLFLEDVNERPYRLDRMLTQLALAGVLRRSRAIVFGEMTQCDEPGGDPTARDTIRRLLDGFPGPVLFGFPSGHTTGPAMTLPLGVNARVVATAHPRLVIEDAAVE